LLSEFEIRSEFKRMRVKLGTTDPTHLSTVNLKYYKVSS